MIMYIVAFLMAVCAVMDAHMGYYFAAFFEAIAAVFAISIARETT